MDNNSKYDAILFLSFGGPEGMADVMPFLANVLRGKNVPEARMKAVAHHYELFDGVSPINGQNRRLIAALEKELLRREINLPVYFGNRNWHPMLADTLRKMHEDGKKNILTFVTSAYSSYSGCRQYLEDMQNALEETGLDLNISKLPVFFDDPLFVEANLDCMSKGLAQFSDEEKANLHIAFTAHSIPLSMAEKCQYQKQLEWTSAKCAEKLGEKNWKLVYQSRSGPPTQPWLEPDILDHINTLHGAGVSNLLIHPIGFVSDHMEIIYDLDTEARDLCQKLGIKMVRSKSSGNSEHFYQLMGSLVEKQIQSKEMCACAPDCCLK